MWKSVLAICVGASLGAKDDQLGHGRFTAVGQAISSFWGSCTTLIPYTYWENSNDESHRGCVNWDAKPAGCRASWRVR
jgi:hypothetical protein